MSFWTLTCINWLRQEPSDLRPEPRRRSDLMGFNSTWWMAVGWLIVIVLVVSPYAWWW